MARFSPAVKKVLIHEGGFVNDPRDLGKATNFGITQKTYEQFMGRKVSLDEMINMPKGNAVTIYKERYWDTVKGDDLTSYAIAFALFDQGVNRGPARAIRQAQQVLGIFPDGYMDSETVKRLNNVDEADFMDKYLEKSAQAYRNIVAANSSQSVFLRNWLHRVESIRKYTKKYIKEPTGINWGTYAIWSVAIAALGGGGYYAYTAYVGDLDYGAA